MDRKAWLWVGGVSLVALLLVLFVFAAESGRASDLEGKTWVVTELSAGDASAEPRAYRLPYSRALHEDVLEALNERARGVRQAGRVESARGSGRDSVDRREPAIRFFEPPKPTLPEKRSR